MWCCHLSPYFCVHEQINPAWAPLFVKHYLLLLQRQQRDANLSQMNEPRPSVITGYCSNQAGFERRGTLSYGQLIKITRKRGSPIILGLLKWGLISAPLSQAGTSAFVSTTGARWQNKAFLPGVLTEGSQKAEPLAWLHHFAAHSIHLDEPGVRPMTTGWINKLHLRGLLFSALPR